MKQCEIFMHGIPAGELKEEPSGETVFRYNTGYDGPPVSVTLPVREKPYRFEGFPPVFDGLLPEASNLQMMLTHHKIQPDDYFSQLLAVGEDLVGAITIREAEEES